MIFLVLAMAAIGLVVIIGVALVFLSSMRKPQPQIPFLPSESVQNMTPSQQAANINPRGPSTLAPRPIRTPTPTATVTQTPVPTATFTPTPSPTPTEIPPTPVGQADNWSLIFRDEFNGSGLDTQKWTTCFWWGNGGCTIATNHELEWYQPQNAAIKNGVLELRAQREKIASTDGKFFPFTSGMVTTGRESDNRSDPARFTFRYGYVEIRARVPAGKGLLPAFWLLPANNSSVPEIDVMEVLGHAPNELQMHYHFRTSSGDVTNQGTQFESPVSLADGWHTYGLDWEPDSITWYVDGVERWQYTDVGTISSTPMYLLLNLAVGGDWPGNPDDNTVFPSVFQIDYVRVWQQNNLMGIAPGQDTYVDKSEPKKNFGGGSTTFSDGDPTKITYLKYDLSQLAGRKILSAVLHLTTANQDGAESPDSHDVVLVEDTSWQEKEMTFQNRPDTSGPVLGTLPKADNAHTSYEVPLDASQLQPYLGKEVSLAIQSSGTDGLYFYAKESGVASTLLLLKLAPQS
jgi:beta-glucanase (GH16 family)